MQVNDQSYYRLQKSTIACEAVWTLESVRTRRIGKSLSLPGIEPLFPGLPTVPQSLYRAAFTADTNRRGKTISWTPSVAQAVCRASVVLVTVPVLWVL